MALASMNQSSDDEPMASDQIVIIREWLDAIEDTLNKEQISYGELAELQEVYNLVKDE